MKTKYNSKTSKSSLKKRIIREMIGCFVEKSTLISKKDDHSIMLDVTLSNADIITSDNQIVISGDVYIIYDYDKVIKFDGSNLDINGFILSEIIMKTYAKTIILLNNNDKQYYMIIYPDSESGIYFFYGDSYYSVKSSNKIAISRLF